MDGSDASRRAARHTLRTVSVGTLWRVLRYPFLVLSVSIIPRMMGTDVYGQYACFMSVFLVFDCLTDLGISAGATDPYPLTGTPQSRACPEPPLGVRTVGDGRLWGGHVPRGKGTFPLGRDG